MYTGRSEKTTGGLAAHKLIRVPPAGVPEARVERGEVHLRAGAIEGPARLRHDATRAQRPVVVHVGGDPRHQRLGERLEGVALHAPWIRGRLGPVDVP